MFVFIRCALNTPSRNGNKNVWVAVHVHAYIKRKGKICDAVVWQTPQNTPDATKMFDYMVIMNRLRIVSLCNKSHPASVVNLKCMDRPSHSQQDFCNWGHSRINNWVANMAISKLKILIWFFMNIFPVSGRTGYWEEWLRLRSVTPEETQSWETKSSWSSPEKGIQYSWNIFSSTCINIHDFDVKRVFLFSNLLSHIFVSSAKHYILSST